MLAIKSYSSWIISMDEELQRYKEQLLQKHEQELAKVKHSLKEEMSKIKLVRNRAGLMLTSFMHSMINVEAVNERLIHGDVDTAASD